MDTITTGLTTGAGLGALGFWLFIAAIIIASVWSNIRRRDAQHETLRRIIESGQPTDADLTDKLLMLTGDSKHPDRDMRLAGLIIICQAPAIALFGWLLSLFLEPLLLPILASVGALLLCLGGGFLFVAKVMRRWQEEDAEQGLH